MKSRSPHVSWRTPRCDGLWLPLCLAMVLAACSDDEEYKGSSADIQAAIDGAGSGGMVVVEPGTYLIDEPIKLRDYRDLRLYGHGAVLRRAPATSGTLRADHVLGSTTLSVGGADRRFKVGDFVVIVLGRSDAEASVARRVLAVDGDAMTLQFPFREFAGRTTIAEGARVLKVYPMMFGMPSADEAEHGPAGSNPGVVIEGFVFDGGWRANAFSHSWRVNTALVLHGKGSSISNNVFRNMPNETLVGHGFEVTGNRFENLAGSAIHMSVNDQTVHLNTPARVSRNIVMNPNMVGNAVTGHSEGAITFSWGGGYLVVEDNQFISEVGRDGVFGSFSATGRNDDRDLIVRNNYAYNFERIITLRSWPGQQPMNVLIEGNTFDHAGHNDFRGLIRDPTIRFGCNEFIGNTVVLVDSINDACEIGP